MDIKGLADFSRELCAEGAVLLKNDNNMLPVRDEKISVFGRTQINYLKSGTGSGGAVNVRKVVNVLEGLRQNPHIILNEKLASEYERLVKENPADYSNTFSADFSDKEIDIDDELIANAAEFSKKAIIIMGRTSGESYDNCNEPGSFLLSPKERKLITRVCKAFEETAIIINSGNILNTKEILDCGVSALMMTWQGGQFGGKAIADLLSGDRYPSGKLSDTIAYSYEDYPSTDGFGNPDKVIYAEDIYVGYRYFETFAPEKVLYPFGFGLSYTEFKISNQSARENGEKIIVEADVKNIGNNNGKQVVQVYYSAPQGKLGKPVRCLAAYQKTKELKPQESQHISIEFDIDTMSSYDDSGITGFMSSYVLEAGDYSIYVGSDVRETELAYTYNVPETAVTQKSIQAMAPIEEFKRLKASVENGNIIKSYEPVTTRASSMEARMEKEKPSAIEYTGRQGYRLADVYSGKTDMDSFIAQLDANELAYLVRGEGMLNPRVTAGTASCFGGVSDTLIDVYGIPPCATADGPSGIRMDSGDTATNLPNGTLQACTWNPVIVEEAYRLESLELALNNIDAQLGPGMNIHRNPLCGRNFEYFSEDPLLSGLTAAAVVRGIQSGDCAATIKHFACNNQEYLRNFVEAVVSERALREIYLKTFEIAVKTANPKSVMTSYNPINGNWSASNYDLTHTLLRGEWGFDGFVMTDWWPNMNHSTGEEPSKTDKAAMVKAENDVNMCTPNGTAEDNSRDNIMESLENGYLSIGELQRCAKNICNFIMKSPAFKRAEGIEAANIAQVDMHPQLSGIEINGKALDDFDPFVQDYYAEDISNVDVSAPDGIETKIEYFDGITEITVSGFDKSTIYKLIQGNEDVLNKVQAEDMGTFFINGETIIPCHINAKGGDYISMHIRIKKEYVYSASLFFSSESNELAQLALFAELDGETFPISLCGTNGKADRAHICEKRLFPGEYEFKISFAPSNFGTVDLSGIRFSATGE